MLLVRIALLCGIALRVAAATEPLPPLVDYVTYLGGSYADTAVGIAVDSTGSAYVAGNTLSPDFPVTSTSLGTPSAISNCAFVTKFNSSGSAVEFSVCLANSEATAFALDASGNMYLALWGLNLPSTSFEVVKLDPTAQSILFTATIGASAESMAVDAAGDIYVAGAAGRVLPRRPGRTKPRVPEGSAQVPIQHRLVRVTTHSSPS